MRTSLATSAKGARRCEWCAARALQRRSSQLASASREIHHSAPAPSLSSDPFNSFNFRYPSPMQAKGSSGPLAGWKVSIKDNFCTKDAPSTASSRMLEGFQSPFDAEAVARLRTAGAILVGKTNCDEFGMGSANVHSHFGPVINPAPSNIAVDAPRRVAGGSSGGAAVSVKTGEARIALASDTGGSIRLPSSYCGVWGLKPTYGSVSRLGLISYADSLDTVGLLASNGQDLRIAFDIISGYDEQDPMSMPLMDRQKATAVAERALLSIGSGEGNSLQGLRVGVPLEYFPAELHPRVLAPLRNFLTSLRDRGAIIVSVSLPSTKAALSSYYVLSSAEASSNMARYDGVRYGYHADPAPNTHPYATTRSQGFGAEVQRRILLGTFALSADAFDNYYLQAQRVRLQVQKDFDDVLRLPHVARAATSPNSEGVDVLVHPSAVDTAPTLESMSKSADEKADDVLKEYVQDVLTVPASLAGLPSVSIPAGAADDGWPVGVAVTTQYGCEAVLWRVIQAMEGEM